jgi:chloramphenicol 3-O phosphotransferase
VIVVLNGTSSAGKTTLAKALQDTLPTPYLLVGIDTVVFALPRRYLNEQWQDVYRYTYAGDRIVSIRPTEYGDRLIRGLHASVAALADEGLDVIVDHVLTEAGWVDHLERTFAGRPVVRVAVTCPLAVTEERERARNDRTLGQARAQFDLVHRHLKPDVTLDTSTVDPAQGAALVLRAM